jgi:hypothetical protein
MASTLGVTELANLALSKLGPGGGFLTNFMTDTSVQAQCARRTYDAVRDEVNEVHPWRFARTRAALAASPTAPAWGFATQFPLPSDFLRVISLEGSNATYEVEGGLLLSDEEGPLNIRYIARVTDVSRFTPNFIAAFTTRWAIEMSSTITKSPTRRSDLWEEYLEVLKQARHTDAIGSATQPAADGDWLNSRA